MRLPFPPLKGDKAVPFHRIRYLSKRHKVTLLSFVESAEELRYLDGLTPYCHEIHTVELPPWRSYLNMVVHSWRRLPLQVLYYRSSQYHRKLGALLRANAFDVVHTVLARGAPYTMDIACPVKVLDMIDALSLNMARRARMERGLARCVYSHEADRMRNFEKSVSRKYDLVLVVSNTDRDHLGEPNAAIVPAGVVVADDHKGVTRDPATVIFTGNLSYFPNQDAALFLARDLLPSLRCAIPGVKVKIAGSDPPKELRQLAARLPDLEVTGYVPDLMAHLRRATVAVCPMRTGGSGMHFKVLEAMACGIPVVASPMAVSTGEARPGEDVLLAQDVGEFSQAILALMKNPELALKLSVNGKKLVSDKYTWEISTRRLEKMYAKLLERNDGGDSKRCVWG